MFIATVVYSQNKDNGLNVNPLPDTTGIVALTSTTSTMGNISLPQIIPPSPASQPFQKFAGYTPNLATGAVNVSIPLYTLSVGNFALPLSLNYHSNGIKVYDLPFPLGYGWILTLGLRVSRTIMGRPDEIGENKVNPNNNPACSVLQNALLGNYEYLDSKYDLFSVSLPNRSVNFFIKKVNQMWEIKQGNSSLKINIFQDNSKNNQICKIEVIDEDGVKYIFGDDSYSTTSNFLEISNCGSPTSWMLQKIVLPEGRTIDFTWESANYIPVQRNYQSMVVIDDVENGSGITTPMSTMITFTESVYEWGDVVHFKQLKKITLSDRRLHNL